MITKRLKESAKNLSFANHSWRVIWRAWQSISHTETVTEKVSVRIGAECVRMSNLYGWLAAFIQFYAPTLAAVNEGSGEGGGYRCKWEAFSGRCFNERRLLTFFFLEVTSSLGIVNHSTKHAGLCVFLCKMVHTKEGGGGHWRQLLIPGRISETKCYEGFLFFSLYFFLNLN